MSKRDSSLYIIDILIAIDKINRYTTRCNNGTELLHNELEWDATLRELQLIGDAVNSLLKEEMLPREFRRVVDFRNQIVHGYFGIDEKIVWSVIHQKLPELRNDIEKLRKRYQDKTARAIQFAIEENSHNNQVVDFLKSLP